MLQYTCEIEIEQPRARVIELFDSVENLYKWQRGLQSFEHKEGQPGQPGAKSLMVFQHGSRRMEMTETVTAREFPDRFEAIYEMKGVHNVGKNRFVEVDPGKTRWISDQVFEFAGFMKVFGLFFKGAFPKQTLKFMEAFKTFAETGKDVRQEQPGGLN